MKMGNQNKFLVSVPVMDITAVPMYISFMTSRNFHNWKTKVIYT